MSKVSMRIAIFALACVIAVAMLYVSTTVYSKADLETVSCGLPLHFLVQDKSKLDPPFPWKVSCAPYSLEHPTIEFSWSRLFFNIAFFYVLLSVLKAGVVYLRRNSVIKNRGGV